MIELSRAAVRWSAILILQARTWTHRPHGYRLRMRVFDVYDCIHIDLLILRGS